MNETLVTQCPACGTRFKLSRTDLSAANGVVRCGACLEVFAAENSLIVQSGQSHFFSFKDETEKQAGNAHEQQQEPFVDEQYHQEGSGIADAPRPDPAESSDDDEMFTDWYHGTEIVYHLTDDESTAIPESAGTTTEPLDVVIGSTEQLDEASRQSLDESIDEISISLVEVPDKKSRLRYYLAYGLVNLLLLLILGSQFLWFNKSQLAARENLRGYYLQACQVLEPLINCQLPDYVNLGQISTRKLIVRSHPKIKKALVIDAIILNSAAFPQPFPRLELKFTDLDFKTIASRRFNASEYLGGELTGLKFIPARTEVRVALEIVDPGNLAVSYELYAVHP